jgi:hypothetical protein
MRIYVGLVHYPVYNKNNERIASALTTMDVHDIARLSKTYGAKGFYVVTPLEDQKVLAEQIKWHWIKGHGSRYNRNRKEAIELVRVASSLKSVIVDLEGEEKESPLLLATDARANRNRRISYGDARDVIERERLVLLLFGTAWGLHESVLEQADYVLPPIEGRTGYNHLSVRSAAAIIIDRLLRKE